MTVPLTMYNPRRQRYAAEVGFGWAVYTCSPPDDLGNVCAIRRGIVASKGAARRWVYDGEDLFVTRVENTVWLSTALNYDTQGG
jgi:hypothetical protein